SLDGTVTDDGRPTGSQVTQTWSLQSGPSGGTVSFTNAQAVDTQASFNMAGTFVLRLSASDGSLSAQDVVTVTVQAAPAGGTVLERRIATGADDAEESATGSLTLTSSDIELVYDGGAQKVGLRFSGLTIPRGVTITRAYLQFTVDEVTL